ncbi:hypothetical protein D9615_009999 [Tricholomella constricta]|uniref:Uncharacterized protein n=1 Tax=Tricholomella constricta TaxID=117010 RepID=A0A8H5GTX9_9AGAR|nr:hypothetical protein D9615_009999 [Tricholomella constricta]
MAALPILLGLFFGSVGYGINLITFFSCILTLLVVDGDLKPRHEISIPMTAAASTMIAIATGDIVVEVCQNVAIFVDKNLNADPRVGGNSQWWSITLFAFFVAQMTVGDTILIYRCFVVWSRKWRVILVPIILSLAATGCGLAAIIIASTTFVASNRGRITPLITTMLAVTLTSNFTSSSLIVFRIWTIHKLSSRYKTTTQDDPLRRAIRVTVEAGLLYTASLFVLLGIYLDGGQAQHAVFRAIVQIIGITFNLVISRTARKRSETQIISAMMSTPIHPMVINTEVVVSRDPPDVSGNPYSKEGESNANKRRNRGLSPRNTPDTASA